MMNWEPDPIKMVPVELSDSEQQKHKRPLSRAFVLV